MPFQCTPARVRKPFPPDPQNRQEDGGLGQVRPAPVLTLREGIFLMTRNQVPGPQRSSLTYPPHKHAGGHQVFMESSHTLSKR